MSEVSGPAAVTLNEYYAPGWCGPAVPGVEIKLEHVPGRDRPGEGEVCFRGRSVMLGYLRDAAKTREAVDDAGWNHSGDTGALRSFRDGAAPMLKITGRIKELLITAGGENVAPVPIEDALKAKLPGVSTAVVVGDKLKFLSVLLTLKQRPDDATGSFEDVLVGAAAAVNPAVTTARAAADDREWRSACQTAIDQYNATAVSSAQRVQKFAILPLDFSQATGELTPTLKLKRAAVVEKYGFVLSKIYGDAASAVWM
jgi:long-chain-fatty-acid--CoA ligase ACSBG